MTDQTALTEHDTDTAHELTMPAHDIALINAQFAANMFAALARNDIPKHQFSYHPRKGSVAYRVLEHFKFARAGSKLDSLALCDALEIQRMSLVSHLVKAQKVGLLHMEKIEILGQTKCVWSEPKRTFSKREINTPKASETNVA